MLFGFSVVFWGQALASNIKSHLVRGQHWGSGVGYILWGFEEGDAENSGFRFLFLFETEPQRGFR